MSRRSAVIAVVMLAALAAGSLRAAEQSSDKAVMDEVIRLTKAAWAASMQKNGAEATRIIASDYTEFNGDYATRIEGKEIAARLMEADFQGSGKLLVADMVNPKVQVYGNVAILSYNYVGVVQDKEGKNQPVRAKSTRVYAKQGTEWKLVHANFAPDPLPTQ